MPVGKVGESAPSCDESLAVTQVGQPRFNDTLEGIKPGVDFIKSFHSCKEDLFCWSNSTRMTSDIRIFLCVLAHASFMSQYIFTKLQKLSYALHSLLILPQLESYAGTL
jgi:hypothetical protein